MSVHEGVAGQGGWRLTSKARAGRATNTLQTLKVLFGYLA
jgi:hypothetical protein